MKQLAILRYSIMFDPSEAWTNGYQFEKDLANFMAAHGKEAQIIQSAGGTGERVIYIQPLEIPIAQKIPQPKDSKPAAEQIKQVQMRSVPKDFKKYVKPKHITIVPRKLGFTQPGNTNRQKVRTP